MPRSSNQKLKLLYLKDILESYTDDNHPLSTNELINKLEDYGVASERKSVYDDIEKLLLYGLDIVNERGRSNGYYIASRHFELPELKLLVDSVQSSKFLTLKKSEQLISKIESLCSKHEASQLQRQVFVANRIKNMNESIYYNVDDIHRAISANKKISFKYFYYNVKKERIFKRDGERYVVSPYALMWDDENYYLMAFDVKSGIFKHYRVDKITQISVLDMPREANELFEKIDLSKYSKSVFSMFGGENHTVKMRFDNSLAGVVIDRFGKDISLVPCGGDFFEVTVDIAVSPQFFGWIFSLEGKAVIVSPKSDIDAFNNQLKKIKKAYK